VQWLPEALTLGIRRQGCEADQSPPSSAEVRRRGAIPLLPQYVFMASYLVKHGDNFTFTFILDVMRPWRWWEDNIRMGLREIG